MTKLSDLLDRKREIETDIITETDYLILFGGVNTGADLISCAHLKNFRNELETVNAQIEALADKEDRRMR